MPLLPRQDVAAPLSLASSTSTPMGPSPTTSVETWQTTMPVYTGSGHGGSTSLYLFTFLITILVLALISGALVLRAYILRRRFQQRIEDALRQGQPLPADAAAALGLIPRGGRGAHAKKEPKVGAMPSLWEGAMVRDMQAGWVRDGEKEDLLAGEKSWDGLTPLTILTSTTTQPPPPPPPPPAPPMVLVPLTPGSYLRSLFSTRMYYAAPSPEPHPNPDAATAAATAAAGADTSGGIPRTTPSWNVPQPGEEFTVGVMIAMPCEPGHGEELWEGLEDEEERDLPEVTLGVMSARMGEH